jgi:predicted nucleic-acid-binding Zn-ribbon protein
MKKICPKCKGYRKDPFSLDGKNVFDPKWKTLVKGVQWECRNCGYVKEEKK